MAKGGVLRLNEVKEIIYESLRQGDPIAVVCDKAGIAVRTYNHWLKQGKDPLPTDISQKPRNIEYYREFYYEVEKIKLEIAREAEASSLGLLFEGESKTIQEIDQENIEYFRGESDRQRSVRRYRQARRIEDDYLYGRYVEEWRTRDFKVVSQGKGMPDELVEVEIIKRVKRPPPEWILKRILPDVDLTNHIRTSVEMGLISPEAIAEMDQAGIEYTNRIIQISDAYRTKPDVGDEEEE